MLRTLILDCEGVLVDCAAARLIAANAAFKACELDANWDEAMFLRLFPTAGFSAQAAAWFDRFGWPGGEANNTALINKLAKARDAAFIAEIRAGCVSLKQGVAELVKTAKAAGLQIAICGEENSTCVTASMSLLGLGGSSMVDVALGGEDVDQRKPAAEIYLLAAERTQAEPDQCLVVEDTATGIRAALAAGMSARLLAPAGSTLRAPEGAEAIASLTALMTEIDAVLSKAA